MSIRSRLTPPPADRPSMQPTDRPSMQPTDRPNPSCQRCDETRTFEMRIANLSNAMPDTQMCSLATELTKHDFGPNTTIPAARRQRHPSAIIHAVCTPIGRRHLAAHTIWAGKMCVPPEGALDATTLDAYLDSRLVRVHIAVVKTVWCAHNMVRRRHTTGGNAWALLSATIRSPISICVTQCSTAR